MVFATTEDGFVLEGLLITPRSDVGALPLVILVHGMQKRFCEPEFVAIGRALARRGYPFLTVNTRGHDLGAWFRTSTGFVLAGSAWEHFIDCPFDIAAWTEFARGSGFASHVFVGVGYGAPKVVFYQAQRQDRDTAGFVFVSSGTIIRDKILNPSDPDTFALAKKMIADGRGHELMPLGTVPDSQGSTVSAEVYANRDQIHREFYGEDSDIPPALAQIRQPIFVLYGSLAERPGRHLPDFIEAIRRTAVQSPEVQAKIIDGASNHMTGYEDRAAGEIATWIDRVVAIPKAV